MANWFCGEAFTYSCCEASASFLAPALSNSRFTCHAVPDCGMPAEALVTLVPSMKAGSRRYLMAPSLEQVTRYLEESAVNPPWRFAGLLQSRPA